LGAEVVRLQPGSAGARSGLAVGDVITLFADVPAPSPTQVIQAFAAMRDGERALVGVTRSGATHVMAIER
jgi:S1-C subfamily serine protease